MTRDEVSLMMREAGVDANVDDVYYIVAQAIKYERAACMLDVDDEMETWGAQPPVRLACAFIKDSIKNRGMA